MLMPEPARAHRRSPAGPAPGPAAGLRGLGATRSEPVDDAARRRGAPERAPATRSPGWSGRAVLARGLRGQPCAPRARRLRRRRGRGAPRQHGVHRLRGLLDPPERGVGTDRAAHRLPTAGRRGRHPPHVGADARATSRRPTATRCRPSRSASARTDTLGDVLGFPHRMQPCAMASRVSILSSGHASRLTGALSRSRAEDADLDCADVAARRRRDVEAEPLSGRVERREPGSGDGAGGKRSGRRAAVDGHGERVGDGGAVGHRPGEELDAADRSAGAEVDGDEALIAVAASRPFGRRVTVERLRGCEGFGELGRDVDDGRVTGEVRTVVGSGLARSSPQGC